MDKKKNREKGLGLGRPIALGPPQKDSGARAWTHTWP
jgi:hypothetical protein